jgi:hypothetical protein
VALSVRVDPLLPAPEHIQCRGAGQRYFARIAGLAPKKSGDGLQDAVGASSGSCVGHCNVALWWGPSPHTLVSRVRSHWR